ncbi:hypothetical protein GW17_00021713 [Ensete ventricosum]|nr:hypothetical protein GW17_00021713 [Ensete ventricosum]RZS03683.1 hypothetical protein BHM03_00033890 [Ensete ventricosum]
MLLFLGPPTLSTARGRRIANTIRRSWAISSMAGDSFSLRGEKERGDERVVVTEKLLVDGGSHGGSCELQPRIWRKLLTAVMTAAKAANGDVMGGGSFRDVRRW